MVKKERTAEHKPQNKKEDPDTRKYVERNTCTDSNATDDTVLEVSSHEELEYPVTTQFVRLSSMYLNMARWHWHEEIEILIVNNGHVTFKTEESDTLLGPGQGIFVNQNVLHSLLPSQEDDCSLYSILFHPAFLFGYGNPGMSAKYLTPVLTCPGMHFLLLDDESEKTGQMLNLVNDAIAYNLARRFGYELRTKGCLCEFWYLLLEHAAPNHAFGPAPHTGSMTSDAMRVKQAIRFIEEKHTEQVSLDDISAAIHISKSECCRCFKRTLGLTPFEYLLKYRIYESTRLLRQEGSDITSIADLAAAVGFNSTSYYNKLFKKYLNCTPLEYKRQLLTSARLQPPVDPDDQKHFEKLL